MAYDNSAHSYRAIPFVVWADKEGLHVPKNIIFSLHMHHADGQGRV